MLVHLRVFFRFGNDGQNGPMTNNDINIFQHRFVFSCNLNRAWDMCVFFVFEHLKKYLLEIISYHIPFFVLPANHPNELVIHQKGAPWENHVNGFNGQIVTETLLLSKNITNFRDARELQNYGDLVPELRSLEAVSGCVWKWELCPKQLMWVKQQKTIPQITINRCYKPFQNGWFIIVLPTLCYMRL
jgi:hypothetical protein